MWIFLAVALVMALSYSLCCIQGSISGGREVWSGYWNWWNGISFIYCVTNCVAVELFYRIMKTKIEQKGNEL